MDEKLTLLEAKNALDTVQSGISAYPDIEHSQLCFWRGTDWIGDLRLQSNCFIFVPGFSHDPESSWPIEQVINQPKIVIDSVLRYCWRHS